MKEVIDFRNREIIIDKIVGDILVDVTDFIEKSNEEYPVPVVVDSFIKEMGNKFPTLPLSYFRDKENHIWFDCHTFNCFIEYYNPSYAIEAIKLFLIDKQGC